MFWFDTIKKYKNAFEEKEFKMKKSILTSVFLVVAIFLASCAGSTQTGANTPIKIGVIYNVTGAQASLDAPSYNGAMLAAKEINAAGGVLGRQIQIVFYDGKSDATVIGNAATQLVETDKVVAMMGFSDSDMTLAAAPIAAKAGIVFVTSGATSPKLPDQVPDYLFLACFGDNVQAAAGAEYAYNTLNYKSVYLLTDQGMEYTKLLSKYFKERYTELGGQVTLEDSYQTGDKDFSAQITRLKGASTQPDFLYIAAGPDDIGTIVKQFRDSGIDKAIMGGDGYDTPLLVQIPGKGATNVYFTTHSLMDPNLGTDPIKKFISAYTAEYGNPPENAFAALGYDTMKLIADAISRAKSTDLKAIRDALTATKDFPGITGKLTYLPGSRVPQKGVALILVKDQKLTLAAEVVPGKIPAP
jgi:branched-chain amino acid transport system substrate-binding protein